MNSVKTRAKSSKLEKKMNQEIFLVFIVQLIFCLFCSAFCVLWNYKHQVIK